ncbi:MAG TPA: YeeE/YedE family protein [Burkholderiales bacterium]
MTHFTPVASLAGGVLIGAAAVWLLAVNGRIAGVSTILHGLVVLPKNDRTWRVAFLAGLIAAGFLWQVFTPPFPAREGFGLGWAAAAGLLVGYGTRLGNGCTSGHGVCGLGRRSLRSLVAVCVFMATGMISVYIARHLLHLPS